MTQLVPIVETKTNSTLKHNGKEERDSMAKVSRMERDTLSVAQLKGSTRLDPLQAKDDIKRIRKLKMKPNNFDNMHHGIGGMGDENLE